MILDCDAQYNASAADNTVCDVDDEDFCWSCRIKVPPWGLTEKSYYILQKFGATRGYIALISQLGGTYEMIPRFFAIDLDASEWYAAWALRFRAKEVDDNIWHHLAWRIDRDDPMDAYGGRTYVDGVDTEGGWEPNPLNGQGVPASLANEGTLQIGGSLTTKLGGKICDLKFLLGGLWTPTQILYQKEHPFDYSAEAGTITQYWECQDGSGITIAGSDGDDLTASDSAIWASDSPINNDLELIISNL